jgi:hypothetical protein
MKIASNFVFIGILSLLIGSAFASPLLISELDIVPFWITTEGPKADFTVGVAYADFTIQGPSARLDVNLGEYNVSVLNYYVVLNVTNHSELPAEVRAFQFTAAKDIRVIPSALGGFINVNKESYVGHLGAARVEGVWLDGEWINMTWVPDGGLDEIWLSEDIFPPKGLEEVWDPDPGNIFMPADVFDMFLSNNIPVFPYIAGTGMRSNKTTSYSHGGSRLYIEGGNYWIEGVPLKEFIDINEVTTTLIYHNGSWIDVSGRVEVKQRPHLRATNSLLNLGISVQGESARNNSIPYSGISHGSSDSDFFISPLPPGFNNTWAPQQSRLILLTRTLDISESWIDDESLKEGEITFYTETMSFLNDNLVNGTYINTYSIESELKTVQLEVKENRYLYNTILADNQKFVTDSNGIEVFIEPRN